MKKKSNLQYRVNFILKTGLYHEQEKEILKHNKENIIQDTFLFILHFLCKRIKDITIKEIKIKSHNV